ncbi:hypothetical protein HD597_006800 [Nonomuraea thailandensis]|uniref:Uncharacterized protein n=1 Tax=Nonomuraea thailandensis TaxID=1188745 RepID=A0A9X2GL44_9ACTN|nr:hypothetical protein [Nonomuraea thailandensis]MCP2359780.1 hypothetical protein [Nonomuraea thailandensis]
MRLTNDQRAALRADRLTRDKRERERRATTFAEIAHHAGTCQDRRNCLLCKAFRLLVEYIPEPTVREDYANIRHQLDEQRERLERIRDVHQNLSEAARLGTPLARTVHDAAWVVLVRLANAWHGEEVEDPYTPLKPDYFI